MTSNENEQPEAKFDAIKADADSLREEPNSVKDEVLERLDKLEFALEDITRSSDYVSKLSSYTDDLQSELASVKKIRFWSVIAAIITVALFLATLVCVTFVETPWFFYLNANAYPALVVATVAGTVFVLGAILRGVFRSIADRNKDDFLPENLRALKEAADGLKNASGS